MKNLDFLLKTLSKVRADVILNIHGPTENLDYWAECKQLIYLLPKNVQVNFFGPYRNEDVEKIFGENDLLFLPTQGENFGHVIFEALKSGLPVLISDRTPWIGLEDSKAGWVGSLEDPNYFIETIDKLASMSTIELIEYKNGAIEYAKNYLRTNTANEDTKALFRYLMG
jgi:glycosyltransferase involved in cell wall biosynthesis